METVYTSGGLITKDPDSYLPVTFDFLLPSTEPPTDGNLRGWGQVVIMSAVFFVEAGDGLLSIDSKQISADGLTAVCRLLGGTLGKMYRVVCRAETNENTSPREDLWTWVLVQ